LFRCTLGVRKWELGSIACRNKIHRAAGVDEAAWGMNMASFKKALVLRMVKVNGK